MKNVYIILIYKKVLQKWLSNIHIYFLYICIYIWNVTFSYLCPRCYRRRCESWDGAYRGGVMDSTASSCLGHSCIHLCAVKARRVKKKKKEGKNHNKKTTKRSTNPAVNESGSLQQFFYALSTAQGDKHNAEPAPIATSPTPLHCKHCRLPHFMSVNPFKPTD